MGVFIRKNGSWVNANNNLDIRGSSSMTGTPTTSNVPKVYAMRSSAWTQIYPPTIQVQYAKNYVDGSGYKNWQGSTSDYPIWGWSMNTPNLPDLQFTGGQGYFGTGVYQYEKNVFKEFAGWTGITRSAISNAGYVGLGNVTKVKSLKLQFNFGITRYNDRGEAYTAYVGVYNYAKRISLVGTNVSSPYSTTSSAANPTISSNRSGICPSDQALATNGSAVEFTWTSSAAMGMVKDLLNGTWDNICLYNGTRPINDERGDPLNYVLTSQYCYTFDYCRYSNVKFKIEYEYQP